MQLTKNAKEAIKASQSCRNRLAYEMSVHSVTVGRWLAADDIMLTTAKALQIISEETGIAKSKLLAA